jgi:hypothetical protein
LSRAKASDSLVHWGDLVAYRKLFHSLVPDEMKLNAASYLLDTKRSLLDAAFNQKNCNAARLMINDLKHEVRAYPSEEKQIKCKLAIGRYNVMKTEQVLMVPTEQISKLCKAMTVLVPAVIRNEASKKLPDVLIETYW